MKKFDYRKYISENKFTIGTVKSKNFENSTLDESLSNDKLNKFAKALSPIKHKGKPVPMDVYLTDNDPDVQVIIGLNLHNDEDIQNAILDLGKKMHIGVSAWGSTQEDDEDMKFYAKVNGGSKT